jgi:hypothetical protein
MKEFIRTGRPPMAPRGTHGTMSEYERGCRCENCRAAARAYQKARRERLKRGLGDFFVSAELARAHLCELQQVHVGMRAVSAVTGIAYQEIRAIRTGRKPRIRCTTEEKIMRVTPDGRSDSSCIDGAETTRLIDELRALGYGLGELARRMGYIDPETLQFYRKPRVTARTAMRVAKLHAQIVRERAARVERMVILACRVA